jgi:hypothetical protein
MTLPALATFWHGERLSDLEMASLHSFRAQGHPVTVYSYAPVTNLPQGVVAGDAGAVFPAERVLHHRRHKSPALHANLFRYAMLATTGQLWVDLDLIALRPLGFDGAHVFGWETERSVNNAVLRLPPDSPTLARLREFRLDTRGVPPHVQGLRRVKYWVRTFGRGYPIEDWLWGSTGPRALTIYLKETGEVRHALPVEAFYPVGVHDHGHLLAPGRLEPRNFGPGTYAVHLWASRLRKTLAEEHGGVVPPGSFVHGAIARARAAGFAA